MAQRHRARTASDDPRYDRPRLERASGVSIGQCESPASIPFDYAAGSCSGPRPVLGPGAGRATRRDTHDPWDMRRVTVAAPVEGVAREMWFVHVSVGGWPLQIVSGPFPEIILL